MSRVTMVFDNESKVEFNELGDALFHAAQQGTAGVTGIQDEDGKSVMTRKQLDAKVAQVQEHANDPDGRVKAARKLAKEG